MILFTPLLAFSEESSCYGTTSDGWLKSGVQLPSKGSNFVSYSSIARLLGRTYVHSAVRDIVLDSYKELESAARGKVFKYAETGYKSGGKFKPHKTHMNGLSVDFMVPVVNKEGVSVHFATNPLNRFGYNVEFDSFSQFGEYKIDYPAMAAHIVALDKAAKAKGYGLWRVIFYPKFQPNLLSTIHGGYLKENIKFSSRVSWVKHDEHYHVDFIIPCQQP